MSFAGRVNWLLFGKDDEECDELFNFIADRLETVEALKKKVQTLEIKHEELKARTLGWQEGFGRTVRKSLQRMDERIVKLLESDDSGSFEINQWIGEIKAIRKDVKALEKRVEAVERIKPIIIRDRTPAPQPRQPWPNWPQPIVTLNESNPQKSPCEFTCQTKAQPKEVGGHGK